MNKLEIEGYEYFLSSYHRLKDLNTPYRAKFDIFDEFYRGYRDGNNYPMAYNYTFNKVIPVIYTILSRIMSSLYREDDIVVAKPKKSKDVRRAELAAGVLNYQLNHLNEVDFQGGSYMVMLQWILSTVVHGKGIVRAFWRKEEETMPQRIDLPVPKVQRDPRGGMYVAGYDTKSMLIKKPQIIYDGPYVENIPVRNFLADPSYRNIHKMPVCGQLYTKSLDWAIQMEKKKILKNIRQIGEGKASLLKRQGSGAVDSKEFNMKMEQIEGAYSIDEIESDRHKAENIDFIDMYGRYRLEGPTYDMNSKINFKGKEDEVICTIANYDTVCRLEKLEYGVRPFFVLGCHMNMSRYWDIGIVELIKDVLNAYSDISNLRLQNSAMKVNTMVKVLIDSEIDPSSLVWKPFGIIPVETMEDVQTLDTPDYSSQVFREQIEFFEKVIQDVTGIYDYTKGVTPERQEHVGTMYAMQSVGEARIKLLLLTMDYMGFRPLLKYLMLLNVYNLPSGFEFRLGGRQGDEQFGRVFGQDLHIDYDFEAKYAAMEPALAKEMRIQQLMQYAQVWQQDPMVNNYELKKAIFELMDFSQPDRFLRDPREVAKEQQQRMMAEVSKEMKGLEAKAKMQQETNKSQEKMATERTQVEIVKALLSDHQKKNESKKN